MNNFLFGVLIGFLTFTDEGKKMSQKAYEMGKKYGGEALKQLEAVQQEDKKDA